MVAASKEATTLPPLSPFGNAVAGSLGALFALMVVYPLDIVKTRLQVQSKKVSMMSDEYYESTMDAIIKIIKAEGITGLYAGLPAGLIGVASTNFAYFYWYSFLRTKYQKNSSTQRSLSTISELLLGALAGALAQIFTIPVSVVTTRQQTTDFRSRRDLIGTAKEIISDDGITGLWRGLKPSLVLCVNPAITYGSFEKFKDLASRILSTDKLSPGIIFLLGALSKTIATIITYPYIMAKVRLQWKPPKEADDVYDLVVDDDDDDDDDIRIIRSKKIDSEDDISNNIKRKNFKYPKYNGAIDVLRKVLETDGIIGWYKGMQAQITKAVLSQALLFYVKEYTTRYTIMLFVLFGKYIRIKT